MTGSFPPLPELGRLEAALCLSIHTPGKASDVQAEVLLRYQEFLLWIWRRGSRRCCGALLPWLLPAPPLCETSDFQPWGRQRMAGTPCGQILWCSNQGVALALIRHENAFRAHCRRPCSFAKSPHHHRHYPGIQSTCYALAPLLLDRVQATPLGQKVLSLPSSFSLLVATS